MGGSSEARNTMVSVEATRVLAAVLAEHEPSISSYGDVACLCGEEFRAGETQSDAGYRKWSAHVIETYGREGNAIASLRDVDAGYR